MAGPTMGFTSGVAKSSLASWVAYVFVLTAPALAADWSLKFGASETASLNDNIDLTVHNPDAALQTNASYSFDLLGQAHTYEIEFVPILGLQRTFFSDQSSQFDFLPSGAFDFRKFGKRDNFDLHASMARASADSNNLVQSVNSTNQGDELTYIVSATAIHKVNDINSLKWVTSATKIDFTEPGIDLVPSFDVTSTGTWQHELSRLVDANVSLGAEYYDPDSPTEDPAFIIRSIVGADAKLSKRLSINGGLGVAVVDTQGSGVKVGPTFNVSVAYKLKTTSLALNAGLNFEPDNSGSLQNTFSSGASISHEVNDQLSWGLSAYYSTQAPIGLGGDTTSSAFGITPSLNYQLSRDWSSSLSYQFTDSKETNGSAYSNAVNLTLSYGTTLIP